MQRFGKATLAFIKRKEQLLVFTAISADVATLEDRNTLRWVKDTQVQRGIYGLKMHNRIERMAQ